MRPQAIIEGYAQSHGALLAFDPEDQRVLYAGANCDNVFGFPLDEVLEATISDVFGPSVGHDLRNVASHPIFSSKPKFVTNSKIGERNLSIACLKSGNHCVVEIEPKAAGSIDLCVDQTLDAVEFITQLIAESASEEQLWRETSSILHYLSGYDRVAVAKALSGSSWEIVHETAVAAEPSRVGLSSEQGGLVSNTVIYDVRRGNIPILMANAGLPPLDLSQSSMRPISEKDAANAVILEATAMISSPIVLDGKLWGSVWFCHPNPRRPPPFFKRVLSCVFPFFCQKIKALL